MTTVFHPAATSRVHVQRPLPTVEVPPRWRRAGTVLGLNTVVGVALLVPFLAELPNGATVPWPTRLTVAFVVWVLSFVPGWLYLRFLSVRVEALWTEYVLTLYRLGADDPAWLPPAPAESGYAVLPGATSGGDEKVNVYRQKFDAYYGRGGSTDADGRPRPATGIDSLFPVYVCTAAFAVAWTLILWNPVTVLAPREPWAVLSFGFLGAYAFAVSTLIRRFYQSDLRPSAYTAVVVRVVVVLLTLAVLRQLLAVGGAGAGPSPAAQHVVAFVVGFFPLVGLQALQRLAATVLRVVMPRVRSDYPLDQIDGLNVWYEARLAEEAVEDMQNLVTMNLVDVILHTRAPVGRIVDWVDQAFLLLHLPPAADDAAPSDDTRIALRRLGIRSATDLLRAFGDDGAACPASGVDPTWAGMTCRLLAGEPGLVPVWNWRAGAARRLGV